MSKKYASTQNVGNLLKFIKEIPEKGTPTKIGIKELRALGYKSSNDNSIIPVLKFVRILDSNGSPSSDYSKFRSKTQAPLCMAEKLREAYPDLFQLYPNAQNESYETLTDFFTSNSDGGAATIKNITKTFQALASFANFDGAQTQLTSVQATPSAVQPNNPIIATPKGRSFDTKVQFNIQVHIPGDQTPEVYESIFKNLGKYVLGIAENE